ncbi:hypothetical protein Pfo_019537 [Paulownia fortunei]|nr:hypothetical protein Pfo_019537 [Paulownia fortunei]
MDVILMQSPVGDSSKKNKNRRRKRRLKKQAVEKNGAEITDQMHDNLEASDKTRDYEVANDKSKKDLHETDLIVQPLAGNPKMDAGSTENLSEGNANKKKKKRLKRNKKKTTIEDEVQSMGQIKTDAGSTENLMEGNVTGKRKRKRKRIKTAKIKDLNMHFSSFDVKDAERLYLKMAPITSIRRKLLVLDVNGLLADIVKPAPKHCRGDIHISGRAIFRRPFCDDFLEFCFQNFDVGIWSSRSKIIIDKVVNYLLGDLKDKLLFCWDLSHSTKTGFKTLENSHKPLVCKELRKIWENDGPNLRWKKGDYNESNTLLLDDSPYKALLNPLHTAIFPYSYCYADKNDNSLGPEGDLRVYLDGLVTSENVQKYVEQHPFGQRAINKQNLSWGFYAGVLHRMSNRLKNKTPRSIHTLS